MMLRSLLLTASAALALGACQEQDQAGATASPAPSGAAARNAETALVKTETRKFRDWLAVCDNGNDCVAFGPALDGGAGGWVRVAMEAGPEARPRITVGLFDRVADPGALGLNIDGRRFVLTDLPVNGPQDSLGMIQNADPRIIAALTQARRLDLDLNQADAVALSPRGAAASAPPPPWCDAERNQPQPCPPPRPCRD